MTRQWDAKAEARLDEMLADRHRLIRDAPPALAFDALRSAGVAIGDRGIGNFEDLPAWVVPYVEMQLLDAWLIRKHGREKSKGIRVIEDSLKYGMSQAEAKGRTDPRPEPEPFTFGMAGPAKTWPGKPERKRMKAVDWLRAYLRDGGPIDVEVILRDADAQQIGKRRSMFAAAKELDVIRGKGSRPRSATWQLRVQEQEVQQEVDLVQDNNSMVPTFPLGGDDLCGGNYEVTGSAPMGQEFAQDSFDESMHASPDPTSFVAMDDSGLRRPPP